MKELMNTDVEEKKTRVVQEPDVLQKERETVLTEVTSFHLIDLSCYKSPDIKTEFGF